jgi:hypothetical protein
VRRVAKLFRISFVLLLLLIPGNLRAQETTGKVTEATAETARISTETGASPSVGDRVKIFYKVPGFAAEFEIATGTVTEVGNSFVIAKIESANSRVAKDQLAKVFPAAAVVENVPADQAGASRVPPPAGVHGNVIIAALGPAFAGWLLGLIAAALLRNLPTKQQKS